MLFRKRFLDGIASGAVTLEALRSHPGVRVGDVCVLVGQGSPD
jgi:hypothetical protein